MEEKIKELQGELGKKAREIAELRMRLKENSERGEGVIKRANLGKVYFDEWQGFPNGTGCINHTAMPLKSIRESIRNALAKKQLLWVEAPPCSGKTCLGQLLEQCDGYRLHVAELDDNLQNVGENHGPWVIDEAQRISVTGRIHLRNILQKGTKVICLGVSGVNTICPNGDSCEICASCDTFKCDHSNDCTNPKYVNTVSLSLTGIECSERITCDKLLASDEELTHYIQLAVNGNALQEVRDASVVAKEIIKVCGGAPGYVVTVLKIAAENLKDLQTELTAEWIRDFCTSKRLLNMIAFERIIELSHMQEDHLKSLSCLLFERGPDVEQEASDKFLRKQGYINENKEFRSPLHQQLALRALLTSQFTWDLDKGPLLFLRLFGVLCKHPSDGTIVTENFINSSISAAIGNEEIKHVTYEPHSSQSNQAAPGFVFGVKDRSKCLVVENLVWSGTFSNSKIRVVEHLKRFSDNKYKNTVDYTWGILICYIISDNISIEDIINEKEVGKRTKLTTKLRNENVLIDENVRFFFLNILNTTTSIHELKKKSDEANFEIVKLNDVRR